MVEKERMFHYHVTSQTNKISSSYHLIPPPKKKTKKNHLNVTTDKWQHSYILPINYENWAKRSEQWTIDGNTEKLLSQVTVR